MRNLPWSCGSHPDMLSFMGDERWQLGDESDMRHEAHMQECGISDDECFAARIMSEVTE